MEHSKVTKKKKNVLLQHEMFKLIKGDIVHLFLMDPSQLKCSHQSIVQQVIML